MHLLIAMKRNAVLGLIKSLRTFKLNENAEYNLANKLALNENIKLVIYPMQL